MSVKENDKAGRKPTFDVYVGHLPKNIEEIQLLEEFSKYGAVADILCRYGKGSYGYAIVKYKYQKDVERLLREVDAVCVNGFEMEVRNAKRSYQSVENGYEPAHSSKSVTFMEPPYEIRSMSYINPPVPLQDNYMSHSPYEINGQPLPVTVEVLCTSVENAVTFYGCPMFRCEELHNLSLKLNSICPNLIRVLKKPVENKVYAAKFTEDNRWYRCSVIQSTIPSKPGVCTVQYVDYGNVDHVSYSDMVELPEPIKRIPTFAVKCILTNLMCNPKSHCDISYLHHLVNQRMSLWALSAWGVPQYKVLKCSCNGIDVVAELVRNGFASYKSQKNSKSSTTANKPDRNHPRSQENHMPKKPNSAPTNSKKANGTNNHHDRHSPSGLDSNKGSIKNSQTTAQCEVPLDFVPKKIIKRGCNISDMASFPASEAAKVKQTVNQFLKVDCVISNLKLVNSVRDLVSLVSDDNLINSAVDILLSESEVKVSGDYGNEVKEAYREYNNVLNEIKNCTDPQLLDELKKRRELQKSDLCAELKKFLQNCDTSVLDKRRTIQKMITDLESNSNAWMNVYLSSQPSTVEDLLAEYNKEKDIKWNSIQKARENTNEKHAKYMEFLSDFQKEFSLNMNEERSDFSYHLAHTEGKKGSWALKFEETLSDLGIALEQEMKTCNVSKGRNRVSVIQCILDKLDIPKEKIDTECEIYEKYKSLYDDLQNMTDLKCVFEALTAVQEEIKNLSAVCVCNEESENKQDLIKSGLFSELHNALSKEDYLLETLAKASALHFPELVLEHPELNLSEHQNYWYLMKHSWRVDFFPRTELCSRVEASYVSKFVDQPVVIKEFEFSNESEKISFMKKAIVWNEIKSKSLVKIKALFKEHDNICAMLSSPLPNLLEKPLPHPVERKTACNVLHQILVGLKDIHSRGMAHGAVHPLSVLHSDGEIMLDFNYDITCLCDLKQINGINFKDPSGEDMCKSADMYGFGCLVLWILFPNLSFTSTNEGVPNISAFQSILEDLLCGKDFTALSALLDVNPDLRPSSRNLLSSGFLKDLRILCDSSI